MTAGRYRSLHDDSVDAFCKQAEQFSLLTRNQEKAYGEQMILYKREIISLLSQLPRYRGCLEEKLEALRDSTKAVDRTRAIIREKNNDEFIRTRLETCLETVQKINDYMKNGASEHQISVKKENKSALLNEFKYYRKFINGLVKDLKNAYQNEKSKKSKDTEAIGKKNSEEVLKDYSEIIEKIFALNKKCEEVFNDFFNPNLRLVMSIANQYRYRIGMEFIDVIHEGCAGLMTALDRYDYTRKCKLSTYATHWIHQAIKRAFQDKAHTMRIPIHIVEKLSKLKNAKKNILRSGRTPTIEEISSATEISIEEMKNLGKVHAKRPLSLDVTGVNEDGDETSFVDYIIDNKAEDPSQNAIRANLRGKIFELLEMLKPRERTAIVLRHGLDGKNPRTLQEVGQILKITRERARQIQLKATQKLMLPSRSRKLEGFLERASFCVSRRKF